MPMQTPNWKHSCKTLLSLQQDPASPAHVPAAHQPSCLRYPSHCRQPTLPRGWGRELGSRERCVSHTRHHKSDRMSLIAGAIQAQKIYSSACPTSEKSHGADMAQAWHCRTMLQPYSWPGARGPTPEPRSAGQIRLEASTLALRLAD